VKSVKSSPALLPGTHNKLVAAVGYLQGVTGLKEKKALLPGTHNKLVAAVGYLQGVTGLKEKKKGGAKLIGCDNNATIKATAKKNPIKQQRTRTRPVITRRTERLPSENNTAKRTAHGDSET